MNTPIERIQELIRNKLHPSSLNWENGCVRGFQLCEQEYQRLWQEFVAELDSKNIVLSGTPERMYNRFQEWVKDKQK